MFGSHGKWDEENIKYIEKDFVFENEIKHIKYLKINCYEFRVWIEENNYDDNVMDLKFIEYKEEDQDSIFVAYCKENKTLYIKKS